MSLKQCCLILGKYSIVFVTHKKLDLSIYKNICDNFNIKYKFEFFNSFYFKDALSYNALLLSKTFYKKFLSFDYILIYQLDAYVFNDDLLFWCNKGYDYIGAPFIMLNSTSTTPVFFDFPVIGNGGFSLRKVNKTFQLFNFSVMFYFFFNLFVSFLNILYKKSFINIFFYLFRMPALIIKKMLCFIFSKGNELSYNEDIIWSKLFGKHGKIPPINEAINFSFENFPEYLFLLSNNKLPFGCHNWNNYYNYLFYNNYIK
jgi:hypothetical protein